MALNKMRDLHPRWPRWEDIHVDQWSVEFDRISDTLYWDFYGEPRAAVTFPVSDHFLLSIDPESEEVIGLEMDGFLAHLVYQVPALLDLADAIGLTSQEVDRIRERMSPDARKVAALRLVFDQIEHQDQGLVLS